MLNVVCAVPEGGLEPGEALLVNLENGAEIETCCYLRERSVTYLRPVGGGWGKRDSLWLHPAGPGEHTLLVAWRTPDGRAGHERLEFAVRGRRGFRRKAPGKVVLEGGRRLLGPSAWELDHVVEAEGPTLAALDDLLRPGDVAYDIGANLGLYTLKMAALTGGEGRVYCFEANPVCVSYLGMNVRLNGLENVEILPVAISDRARTTRLVINYDNSTLGTVCESSFYEHKTGQEIWVQSVALDDLVRDFDLRLPDVVKIDVEGAERQVVEGMAEIIARSKPLLVLELHGYHAMSTTLDLLDGHGYRYRLAGHDEIFRSSAQVCDRCGDRVVQVIAGAEESPEATSTVEAG